jgi:hypothetical protein
VLRPADVDGLSLQPDDEPAGRQLCFTFEAEQVAVIVQDTA